MHRGNRKRPRHSLSATLGKMALLIPVLTFTCIASGASKNDNDKDGNYYPHEMTQVYQHTYDEVFQACQEAVERKGWFVTEEDKDKGTISGHDNSGQLWSPFIFSIHIESLNTKPETQVTINGHLARKGGFHAIGHNGLEDLPELLEKELTSEMQKVLSTFH